MVRQCRGDRFANTQLGIALGHIGAVPIRDGRRDIAERDERAHGLVRVVAVGIRQEQAHGRAQARIDSPFPLEPLVRADLPLDRAQDSPLESLIGDASDQRVVDPTIAVVNVVPQHAELRREPAAYRDQDCIAGRRVEVHARTMRERARTARVAQQ